MLPRSYDERVDHSLHPKGFKMAGKTANFFPHPHAKLQTKDGRERLERAEKMHQEHVSKRKEEYDHFMANKRTIFASQMEPRWAPTTNMGYDFETFVSDPNNLFKKTLDPIDK